MVNAKTFQLIYHQTPTGVTKPQSLTGHLPTEPHPLALTSFGCGHTKIEEKVLILNLHLKKIKTIVSKQLLPPMFTTTVFLIKTLEQISSWLQLKSTLLIHLTHWFLTSPLLTKQSGVNSTPLYQTPHKTTWLISQPMIPTIIFGSIHKAQLYHKLNLLFVEWEFAKLILVVRLPLKLIIRQNVR